MSLTAVDGASRAVHCAVAGDIIVGVVGRGRSFSWRIGVGKEGGRRGRMGGRVSTEVGGGVRG